NAIGANSYLIDTGNCKIILDSGMNPKREGLDAAPDLKLLEPDTVDIVVLTHSHLDHAGTIPLVMRRHSEAILYSTPPTADLAEALMHNSVNVMQSKREELGITDYPLFGHKELDKLDPRWQLLDYNSRAEIAEGVFMTFFNAGHVLGSCGVLIEANGKTLFYTGDIQFDDQCIISGAEFPTEGIDILICETTRGAIPRRADYSREKEMQAFCDAINVALKRGGSVLIPVFAIGKTQEVLSMLHKFKQEENLDEKVPVFIGGLSTKMTLIFDEYAGTPYRSDGDFQIIEGMKLKIGNKRKKRKPITYQRRAVFALSSGMMTEKTVSNEFARTFINNPRNSLLFVGYADPDSPAGKIRKAQRGDLVTLDPDKEDVKLDCDLHVFDFSGHSTRDDILDYIVKVKAKKNLLVHGDIDASKWFQNEIQQKLPDAEAIIPEPALEYKL
ncbi:MBL fold metallo-hydrolase, partial [Akkermansiaceae bacterium]|nr:MBL fold metallo-hydrolase [Akkermansiaceae bacterium]